MCIWYRRTHHCEPPCKRPICVANMLKALDQGIWATILVYCLRSDEKKTSQKRVLNKETPPVHASNRDKRVQDNSDDAPHKESPGLVHCALRHNHRHMLTYLIALLNCHLFACFCICISQFHNKYQKLRL